MQGGAGFPGVKYPNLWILVGVPARGIANDTVRDAMREEVAKIQKDEVTDEELHALQDARESRSAALAQQQHRSRGAVFAALSDAVWRLARVVPLCRTRRQGDESRREARGGDVFVESNRTVARIETQSAAPAQKPASTEAKR